MSFFPSNFVPKTVKMPVGMRKSFWAPIVNEPENSRPQYGPMLDMGAARKGYLSLTTATAAVPGDDVVQVNFEQFVSGTFDAETDCSDLELNASIYGHSYDNGMEASGSEDSAPDGGYAFYEPVILKNKGLVFRATVLPKLTAVIGAEKQEADTKQPGQLDPKVNAVQYMVLEDKTKHYRYREEFATEADAMAWLQSMIGSTAAWPVEISHVGAGASDPGEGVTFVTAGQDKVITFTTDPTALYDNAEDVTSSIASHKYTISSIAAGHKIVAVCAT